MKPAAGRGSVAVRIAGHEYKIRSDGDDDGLVRIAGYVDRAMQRVRERTGMVDSLDVAVLTCLNLAREILAWHERPSVGADDEKVRGLIERVESALSGGGLSEAMIAADSPERAVEAPEAVAEPKPRTIDLPSVEDLRDRMVAGSQSDLLDASQTAPRARAAAGGRERVG